MVAVQGGGTFWVTFTPIAGFENRYDSDRSYEEVFTAINTVQIVMAKVLISEGATVILPCGGYAEGEDLSIIMFGNSVALTEQTANIYGISLLKNQTPGGGIFSELTIKNIE